MKKIGERLKELRKNKGIVQKEIANYLDVTVRTYQYYESGELEPNIERLIKLADFYKISLDSMLGRSNKTCEKGNILKWRECYVRV